MFYLSLAAIVRDERYLREWTDYYRLLGVEHCVIYDNSTTPRVATELRDLVDSGWLEVVRVELPGMQAAAYTHTAREAAGRSRWVAFFDADEFVVPHRHESFPALLEEYEGEPGLGINWQVFGSDGHLSRPHVPQIVAYRRRLPVNEHVHRLIKTVCDPAAVTFFQSAHFAHYRDDRCTVDENHEPIDGLGDGGWDPRLTRSVSVNKVQLNHYWCRSWEDWQDKLERGRADEVAGHVTDYYDHYNRRALVVDTSILRFARRLYPQLCGAPEAEAPRQFARTNLTKEFPLCTTTRMMPSETYRTSGAESGRWAGSSSPAP